MIFDIIMNNPGRYKYMSKSKETVSVCLINLGGGGENIHKQISHFFMFVAEKKHQ